MLCPVFCAQAIEPEPMDFSWGVRISARADNGLWETRLPAKVYEGVTRPDLGDVRIFDGAGKAVPMKIIDARTGVLQKEESVTLRFFPLHTSGDGHIDKQSLRFKINEKRALTSVNSRAPHRERTVLGAYVVDASGLARKPVALRLKWDGPHEKFITTINVEVSRDLNFWFDLVTDFVLAQIPCGDGVIFQNTMEFPYPMKGYWIINWPAGKKGARLLSVEALLPPEDGAPKMKKATATVRGHGVSGEYQFEISAAFPACQVLANVSWTDFCSFARIYSRDRHDAPWDFHSVTNLYNFQAKEHFIKNNPIPVRMVSHRLWRIVLDSKTAPLAGTLPPDLTVSWIPHKVFFVARGQEPFTMAFGSGRENLDPVPTDSILDPVDWGKSEIIAARAQTGVVVSLGGRAAFLKSRPIPPDIGRIRMIQFAFGTLIAAGLVLILWLVLRLRARKKQLAEKAAKKDSDNEWARAAAQVEVDAKGPDKDKETKAGESAPEQENPESGQEAPEVDKENSETEKETPEPETLDPEQETPEPETQDFDMELSEDGTLDQDQLDQMLAQAGYSSPDKTSGPAKPENPDKSVETPSQTKKPDIKPEDSGVISQDNLDALLAEAGYDVAKKPLESVKEPEPDTGGQLSQDDLDAMFDSPAKEPEPETSQTKVTPVFEKAGRKK